MGAVTDISYQLCLVLGRLMEVSPMWSYDLLRDGIQELPELCVPASRGDQTAPCVSLTWSEKRFPSLFIFSGPVVCMGSISQLPLMST